MTKKLTKLSDMYLEPCETSVIESFAKVDNGL